MKMSKNAIGRSLLACGVAAIIMAFGSAPAEAASAKSAVAGLVCENGIGGAALSERDFWSHLRDSLFVSDRHHHRPPRHNYGPPRHHYGPPPPPPRHHYGPPRHHGAPPPRHHGAPPPHRPGPRR